jgi:endonuclease IV
MYYILQSMAFSRLTDEELNEAIANLSSEILAKQLGHSSYTLHSGQGSQTVSRRPIKELMMVLDELENELDDREGNGILTVDYKRCL